MYLSEYFQTFLHLQPQLVYFGTATHAAVHICALSFSEQQTSHFPIIPADRKFVCLLKCPVKKGIILGVIDQIIPFLTSKTTKLRDTQSQFHFMHVYDISIFNGLNQQR